MYRSIAKCPTKLENAEPHPGRVLDLIDIEIITPMFGNGVEAGVNDPVTLIRPSSIRGHLRFWWRATRGAKYTTIAELRQREGEIWGTTKSPSQVVVDAKLHSRGTTYPCAHIPTGKNFPKFKDLHPGYALFPFQGSKKDGTPISECTSKASFELKLIYPKSLLEDVKAAVWAWVNFGGIGARTRRGCGALYCSELSPPETSSIKSWYETNLKSLGISLNSRDWPTLPEDMLVRVSRDPMRAWAEVVGLMQTFRQGQNVGRNPGKGPNRPGRSRWPEPETIRSATSRRDPKHSRMPGIPNDAFPRAEFGLPIVFHFKDYEDPEDAELYPVVNGEEKTRMASPLILRPMICRNGAVLQMILRLRTQSVDEVILKKAPKSPKFKKIRDPTLATYPNSPLGRPSATEPVRSSSGSAIEGFLAFAEENGFVRVI